MVTTGPIAESPQASQVEGRAVVGRRVRDLVLLDGSHDLVRAQRAAAVLVDHLEALARGVLEIVRKFLDLLVGLLGLELALGRPFRELVREGDLDALLPLVDVHVAVIVRVHRREGGLEARRDQQVLQVFIAAVD